MAEAPFHNRLLSIVLKLPGAYEDRPWGSVHCKVAGKIFVGWGRNEEGTTSIGFKTDKDFQAMLVASDPRFQIAKYVGKHGWVNMNLGKKVTATRGPVVSAGERETQDVVHDIDGDEVVGASSGLAGQRGVGREIRGGQGLRGIDAEVLGESAPAG